MITESRDLESNGFTSLENGQGRVDLGFGSVDGNHNLSIVALRHVKILLLKEGLELTIIIIIIIIKNASFVRSGGFREGCLVFDE